MRGKETHGAFGDWVTEEEMPLHQRGGMARPKFTLNLHS